MRYAPILNVSFSLLGGFGCTSSQHHAAPPAEETTDAEASAADESTVSAAALDASEEDARAMAADSAPALLPRCVPGDQQTCACPGGLTGVHLCSALGTWEVCTGCLEARPATVDGGLSDACADVQGEAPRCGSCGRDCGVAMCAGGLCEPTVLARDQYSSALAVFDGYLYWTAEGTSEGGAVRRVPLLGGAIETIADHQHQPGGLAFDASHVYWTFGTSGYTYGGGVMRANLDGSAPLTLSESGRMFPGLVAVDSSAVFWLGEFGRIVSRSLTDTSPESIVASETYATGLVLTADVLYWTQWGGGNVAGVMARRATTGRTTNLIAVDDASALAVDAKYVYWTTLRGGSVMRASLLGDNAIPLAQNQPEPTAIALDRQFVYWVNRGGTIRRVSIEGGPSHTLATEQANPAAIAVDATRVYWSNADDGTIMMLQKSW